MDTPLPPRVADPFAVDATRLGECAMMEGVSLASRNELLRQGHVRHAEEGELLIEAGGNRRTMYLVLEGSLGVHLEGLGESPIALLAAGETAGELSLLDGSAASANVVAAEPSVLLEVDEAAFWELVNASHAFAVNLLGKLAERLRSNNAAVSLNVLQRQKYERVAMFDGLTGIHNRRWLDETLRRMVQRSQRSPGVLSVAIVDVDHFKRFNDQFGHDAGDQVLVEVAQALEKNLRPTDLVARYGGEEFVLLLPDTGLDEAGIAAERMRAVVAALQVKRPDGSELPRVTTSVGVSTHANGQSPADLLKTADQALYAAKQAGRNRVELGRTPVMPATEG